MTDIRLVENRNPMFVEHQSRSQESQKNQRNQSQSQKNQIQRNQS